MTGVVASARREDHVINGKIIRGIAGFYYVDTEVDTAESGIYVCKAKGIFRKNHTKPLVGDYVRLEILDEKDKEANITEILQRKNELIRPAVANVDQALVFFSLRQPDPDSSLIDRFLVSMEHAGIPVLICFNKTDLAPGSEAESWREIYAACGCEVFTISALHEEGTQQLRERLSGKTTVVAGPSGAGKSTLTNRMQGEVRMETGEISTKLRRGRHTTRHAELIPLGENTFFCDTPGFSALDMPAMEPLALQNCFPEFAPCTDQCRFGGCAHVSEPDCAVRAAVEEGRIARSRYNNYVRFYQELREREKRRY